ncbi:hypothetical protein [Sediminibacillus massiliensis]|uniref:hypothetical protein n=1 Tax=Sediminibacillus massiliensis TaxID=1926277 RepID=UPI0009887FD1|nr:hypothetical protein [Sediminibacillus massiliensis]
MAGRKSRWEELEMDDKLLLVEGWARDGHTDKDMMEMLGVSHDVFYKWKREKKEFNDALKKGKEVVDRQVENALLQSALGFRYQEQTVTNKGDVVDVEKYEKPNTTAQIFWLKNRKPDVWRDKQDIKHEGDLGLNVVVDYGDDDEG